MRTIVGTLVLVLCCLTWPLHADAADAPATERAAESRWEVSLDGRIGVPTGEVKVDEVGSSGTRLRLHSGLSIDVSEAVEGNLAYRLTPRDAIRATLLYYFLDGSTTSREAITYNGPTFPPGRLTSSLDFYRLSLSYDRRLLLSPSGAVLTGSLGLTYVSLDAVVHGKHEDFYRQELPVPIAGVRFDYPIGDRLGLTASLSGGALPRVDSLRKEGGTVYLKQSHADAGLGLTYALNPAWQIRAGYHFTYFFQHEQSHEDDNRFELVDNAFQAGLSFRF